MNKPSEVFAAIAITLAAASAVHGSQPLTILMPEQDEIQLALEAGPEHLRAGAAVYVYGKEGYRKVREGTNGFTCMVNRDGNQARDNDLKPTCWDAEGTRTIVPVMLRVGELIARSVSAEEIKREIDAGFELGKFASPKRAGIAYMLRGDLQFDPQTQRITNQIAPPHYMIYAPGVTNDDIGMSAQARGSEFALPSVFAGYSGGNRTAYIIVHAAPAGAHQHRGQK